MPEKLAILGGTFDPVHIAHLRMALEAAEVEGLDRVIFMPCAQNPFDKTIKASARHRLEMLRLATAGHPGFEVSDLEAKLGGKSYTVNTLAKVHELHPEAHIKFLIGADAFFHLHTWHQPGKLFELADFIVMARPKSPTWDVLEYMRDALDPRFRETGDGWVRLDGGYGVKRVPTTLLSISSTDIRRRAALGLSLAYLVPEAVEDYIKRMSLYKDCA